MQNQRASDTDPKNVYLAWIKSLDAKICSARKAGKTSAATVFYFHN